MQPCYTSFANCSPDDDNAARNDANLGNYVANHLVRALNIHMFSTVVRWHAIGI